MPPGPVIVMPTDIIDACLSEARARFPNETGGALMGRRGDSGEFLVEHTIGPGPGALHRRDSFMPDADWQWSEMRRLHAEHGGVLSFLGDWHSHPRSSSMVLSKVDVRALVEILTDHRTRASEVVCLILADGVRGWRAQAWVAGIKDGPDEGRTVRVRPVRLRGIG